jgi:hypothetical protein
LNARICEVSPYLLLKRTDIKPTKADTNTWDFTDFPTIDATELIRIHNTFCSTSLSKEFQIQYEEIRRNRNKISHLDLQTGYRSSSDHRHSADELCRALSGPTLDGRSPARERALAVASQDPPSGVTPDEAVAEVRDELASIGDTCPECPPDCGRLRAARSCVSGTHGRERRAFRWI